MVVIKEAKPLVLAEYKILDGEWLNKDDVNITLSQEESDVKIRITTINVPDNTSIEVEVFKASTGFDESVKKVSGIVKGNISIIDFHLDDNIVQDEYLTFGDNDKIEKLYFNATLKQDGETIEEELPKREKEYLKVVKRGVLVSIFVERPNIFGAAVVGGGSPGHVGVSIDGEYYDYGPVTNGNQTDGAYSAGTPYLDASLRDIPIYEGIIASPDDVSGKDYQMLKEKIFHPKNYKNYKNYKKFKKYRIHEINILVTKEQAKRLKEWWENKYKNLGQYSIIAGAGEHCTTTTKQSLRHAGLWGFREGREISNDPEDFYEDINDIEHTAGFLVNGKIPSDLNTVPTKDATSAFGKTVENIVLNKGNILRARGD